MDNEKLTQLERKINQQSQEIADLKSKSSNLNYTLDTNTKRIIEDSISDKVADIVWENIFTYIGNFESLDGWQTFKTGTGTATVPLGFLTLETSVASSDATGVRKIVSPLFFERPQRFRFVMEAVDTTNLTFYITVGSPTANAGALPYYGFEVINATLYGLSAINSTITTLSLNTTIDSAKTYTLEARYFPGRRIDFYVESKTYDGNGVITAREDRKLAGSISTNVPHSINYNEDSMANIIEINLITNTTAAKTYYINTLEVMQFKR